MYATRIDTCSTLIYINYIHIQVRGGGPDPPDPPPASALVLYQNVPKRISFDIIHIHEPDKACLAYQ